MAPVRPNFPLALTMRTNPSLYPHLNPPLYKGEDARDFFFPDNLRDDGTPEDPHKTWKSLKKLSETVRGEGLMG
jgi:hypothetical protein